MPVPEGFAVSAWAYKRFVDSNNLQERISELIDALNIRQYGDLVSCSNHIRKLFLSSRVPDDVVDAAQSSLKELTRRCPGARFAMRSSAIGEDTLFSFAGQYATFLNVGSRQLIDAYREVLASKFTPQAIYYYLSHAMSESHLAMSVGCVTMIDAVSSGVAYSRSPVDPNDDSVLVSSIWGLGKYLVDGKLTPDTFRVSREEGVVETQSIARKSRRLVAAEGGMTREEAVPRNQQRLPSVTLEQIREIVGYARKLEEHYGSPQDIEWAIDRQGRIFLLQTRPLRVAKLGRGTPRIDSSQLVKLMSGGTTVSPGAGAGEVCHVSRPEDLARVRDGAVLVTSNSFPGIVTVMNRVSAIVTEVGGVANHMATIAREYRVPTLGNIRQARQLPAGHMVTVDATGCVIYSGNQQELVRARREEYDLFSDMAIFDTLRKVLTSISRLNLLHPAEPSFSPENCRTVHDICRYIHQKGNEEIFSRALALGGRRGRGLRLKTDMPMAVRLIYLDRPLSSEGRKGIVRPENLGSRPMEAFWRGIAREGWPSTAPPDEFRRVEGVVVSDVEQRPTPQYREVSFAILSREFMICNLHMGYHFTTVEAMCTELSDRNYIRVQWGDGGAGMEKRVRRISLIADIAGHLGFENYSRADFLNVVASYLPADEIEGKLFLLGRLAMMTKQLDMALSNDDIAAWYKDDIMVRLGLVDRHGGH